MADDRRTSKACRYLGQSIQIELAREWWQILFPRLFALTTMTTRQVLFIFALALPQQAISATDGLPESIDVESVTLTLRLSCPGPHIRTYEVNGTSFRFIDVAGSEGADRLESSKQLDKEVAADLMAAVLSSTFPDLPDIIGARQYLGAEGRVERFHVQVSTACRASLSLDAGSYSQAVSYHNTSLLPGGLLETLQSFSGEPGDN